MTRPRHTYFIRRGDALICPTCEKANRTCLVGNGDGRTYTFRPRELNPGETVIRTFHDEIGFVRIIVRRAYVHGIEQHIIAEDTVCAAGFMLITGWSSRSVRSYGSRIPGRIAGGRKTDGRGLRASGAHRFRRASVRAVRLSRWSSASTP